jgi:hypothetical protein
MPGEWRGGASVFLPHVDGLAAVRPEKWFPTLRHRIYMRDKDPSNCEE